MIPTNPPVAESKYAPFTLEEFQEMQTRLDSIGNYLPEHQMNYMWIQCTKIRGKRENQPCSCRTSGKLWAKCIEDIRTFINSKA